MQKYSGPLVNCGANERPNRSLKVRQGKWPVDFLESSSIHLETVDFVCGVENTGADHSVDENRSVKRIEKSAE